MNHFQIHHVVPHAARIGGYERQARLIAVAQARQGHRVAIITHATGASASGLDEPIPVISIRKRFTRYDQRDLRSAVENADVIHIHALDPLSAEVVLTARSKGIPAIIKVATQGDALTFSDPDRHPPDVADTPRPFETWRQTHQAKALKRSWSILSKCQAFIALNVMIRDELVMCGIDEKRIHQMPNAVLIPDEPVQLQADNHNAISVGRLVDRKCPDLIVEALAIVRSTIPDATLTFVGQGPQRELLVQRIRDFGIENAVHFAGSLADPTPVLRQAGLFILASQKEGCPNALLEAAAHGLPCIATAIPGITDYFDNTHVTLIPPRDPRALAAAWTELLSNTENRQTLATAARTRTNEIAGLGAILDRYDQMYSGLMVRSA